MKIRDTNLPWMGAAGAGAGAATAGNAGGLALLAMMSSSSSSSSSSARWSSSEELVSSSSSVEVSTSLSLSSLLSCWTCGRFGGQFCQLARQDVVGRELEVGENRSVHIYISLHQVARGSQRKRVPTIGVLTSHPSVNAGGASRWSDVCSCGA